MSRNVSYITGGISVEQRTASVINADEEVRLTDAYALYYILSGEGSFFTEGTEYSLTAGSAVLVRPLVCHGVKSVGSTPTVYLEIVFAGHSLPRALLEQLDDTVLRATSAAIFKRDVLSAQVVSVLTSFGDGVAVSEKMRQIYLEALLTEAVVLLTAAESEATVKEDRALGARLVKYITENLTENLSLDTLARAFFVSKYHLCRAFKEYNGISVHGYIIRKRILLARRLIEEGEAPTSVAYRVGFGDYSAFYRAYQRVMGKYPTA